MIRRSEPAENWPGADALRGYKRLNLVEGAFRCLKGVDLKVRPIWLRKPEHVKAHIFLCVLAYYVEWHLQNAWKELLIADEELDKTRDSRGAVLPPEPSASILAKKHSHKTQDGLPLQSFASLLGALGTLTRNTCLMRLKDNPVKDNAQKMPVPAKTKIHRHQRCNARSGASLETAGVVPSTVNGENNGNPCIYRGFLLFVRGTTV